MSRMKWLVAATVLLGVSVTWWNAGGRSVGRTAFADEIPGIDQVRQMTWTVTYYIRMSSKDGQRSWIEKERRLFAYRHPGQYRETRMTPAGEVSAVLISDHNAGRALELRMQEKRAVLRTLDQRADPRGPFAWEGDALRNRDLPGPTRVKSISLQGRTRVENIDLNVARVLLQDTVLGSVTRFDLYLDPTTKQLSGVWCPNPGAGERDELEKLVAPPGGAWDRMEPVAAFTHEIQLQPNLKASDFRLDVPDGFASDIQAPPTVTEEEMLDYLKAAVAFNGNRFPDSLYHAYDSDALNAEWAKDESTRSAAANALITQVDKFRLREIYQSPVRQFVADHTLPDSFQFAASGATYGQANQIICWYRLKLGKQLRALYGDLTIRDITERDLPFSIGK